MDTTVTLTLREWVAEREGRVTLMLHCGRA